MHAMTHIAYLAGKIGPRGSTTAQETEAAHYVEQTLRGLGVQPTCEPFVSAISAWYPYALFSGLALVGELLFLAAGRPGSAIAFLLALVALVAVLLELAFRPNPLRWFLPKGWSQNVWARILPAGSARSQVVLLGHLDSHRTPIVFSSAAWLRLFGWLVPLGLLSAVLLLIIFALGAAMAPSWAAAVSALPSLVLLAVMLLTLQADRTPYSPGASDNATAAGVLLNTVERLRSEPLTQTAVWAVFSGCEEVGCYGAAAFAQAHACELGGALWLPLEMLGNAGSDPRYQTRETFLLTTHSDPGLIRMAERVAQSHPELAAGPHTFAGAYTESVIGSQHGLRVMTVTSFPREGSETEWHRPTDTVERLDPEVLARCQAFVWELLQEIDRA